MTTAKQLPGQVAKCGRCGADIVWARTVAGPNGPGGKPMPLDPTPHPEGNVAVRKAAPGRLLARVLGKDETPDLTVEQLAMPHFATCPGKPGQEPLPIGTAKVVAKTAAAVKAKAEAGPPRRIQCRRTAGWKMPANTVYVGRPTRFGNTFRIGDHETITRNGNTERVMVINHSHAVALYREFQLHEDEALARRELPGKNLACWCPTDLPCHADLLLEAANR